MTEHAQQSTMTPQEHLASPEHEYINSAVAWWLTFNPDGRRRMQETLELLAYSMKLSMDGAEKTAADYEAQARAIRMQQTQGSA